MWSWVRIENIDWARSVYFNPNSKTKKGRRFIPLSDRSVELLKSRRRDEPRVGSLPPATRGSTLARPS